MSEVLLHVYDLKTTSAMATTVIVQLNKLTRDGIGAGGIFHGAIQVYDEEWSFGCCSRGSGIVRGPPKENPMYTYRETVPLGRTELSQQVVKRILTDMAIDWLGITYDVLSKNCNHFCDELSSRLGVRKPPLWVNRWAKIGVATREVFMKTMKRLQRAQDKVASAGRIACRYFCAHSCAASYKALPSGIGFPYLDNVEGETGADGEKSSKLSTSNSCTACG